MMMTFDFYQMRTGSVDICSSGETAPSGGRKQLQQELHNMNELPLPQWLGVVVTQQKISCIDSLYLCKLVISFGMKWQPCWKIPDACFCFFRCFGEIFRVFRTKYPVEEPQDLDQHTQVSVVWFIVATLYQCLSAFSPLHATITLYNYYFYCCVCVCVCVCVYVYYIFTHWDNLHFLNLLFTYSLLSSSPLDPRP